MGQRKAEIGKTEIGEDANHEKHPASPKLCGTGEIKRGRGKRENGILSARKARKHTKRSGKTERTEGA